MKAVTAANMTVVSSLFDDAANTVHQTYIDRDPSITDDAERKRLHEAERQAEASTKTVRQARRITRAAEASASDYAAGEF